MEQINMQVVKRDGRREDVAFEKVQQRISNVAAGLAVNPIKVAQGVLTRIVDGITTTELDNITANLAYSWSTTHPDYADLAGRIAISNHQRNTPASLLEAVNVLEEVRDARGELAGLLDPELVRVVRTHAAEIEARIDYERDYLIDFFGFKTLERAYLLRDTNRKVVERPQHLWMRVALGLWTHDLPKAFETYDLISQKYYTHATPTLFNAGTKRPQLSSCFLQAMKADSIKGIYDTLQDCALISQYGGGIGLHVSNVRAKGTLIRGTGGTSNGLVPMLRVFNNTARYVDQCFVPETLVHTAEGPKRIVDIRTGDAVLTSGCEEIVDVDGKHAFLGAGPTHHRVMKLVEHTYDGPLLTITVGNETSRVTPQHPVLAVRRNTSSHLSYKTQLESGLAKLDYIDIGSLRVGDAIARPSKSKQAYNGFELYEIQDIQTNSYVGKLYDLEVDGTHDYSVVGLGIAHNGGGRRNGSFAIYLEPWHADIEDFLEMKKNTGSEEERARDLFYGLWVPDLFMERVDTNGDWTLFCPNEAPGLADAVGDEFKTLYERYEREGRGRRTVKAQQLWFHILDSQIETGTPYLVYKDAANKKSNQQNLGTIKSSNLCVAPETLIMTDKGQFQISELVGQEVNVWNGEKWSKTTVMKTGEKQKLLSVHLSNGAVIDCTPYHKFLVQNTKERQSIKNATRVEANDLKEGMKLTKWEAVAIQGDKSLDFKEPYTHGFFCGDGNEFTNGKGGEYKRVILCGEKKNLIPYLCLNSVGNEQTNGSIQALVPKELNAKYEVPLNASIKCRLDWLAGLLDADGGVHKGVNVNTDLIDLYSINKAFLDNVRLLLLSLGVQSKVIQSKPARQEVFPGGKEYSCKELYHIPIGGEGIWKLTQLGMKCNRLTFRVSEPLLKNNQHYTTVVSVTDKGRFDDTYCFNEPENHAGVFNGVLTGNCTEIIEFSSPEECAVCNLASMSLPAFVHDGAFDFKHFRDVVRVAVRNLNRVIDINYYPIPEAERSNMRHRPIGLGVQGLADVFAMLGLPWESPEAAALNTRIFAHMYYAAMESTVALAAAEGTYETYSGSPLSAGKFQFDLWNVAPLQDEGLDWDALANDVRRFGVRNSLLVAPMPTASTSQILGNCECFEPYATHIFTRRTLAGEFIVINKHLVRSLIAQGLWTTAVKDQIIANNGSVQGLAAVPEELQRIFKTVWEIKQKTLIDMAADRGPYICQSQSLNLFLGDPDYRKLTSMHFYAWRRGLKTGIYYLRTRAVASAQKFTVEPTVQVKDEEKECVMCSS